MSIGNIFKAIGRTVAKPVTVPVRKAQHGAEKIMHAAIMGIIRHVLTALGGGLVVSGTLSGDDMNAAIGAITTLVGIAWSLIEKRNRKLA